MAVFGELELAVMEVLWDTEQPKTVREVHQELSSQRELAYTTVMTVLDRLAKKHFALRKLTGRAWLYQAADSRAAMIAAELLQVLQAAAESRSQALQQFVAQLSQQDIAVLAEEVKQSNCPAATKIGNQQNRSLPNPN